jgi:hypothetical protein
MSDGTHLWNIVGYIEEWPVHMTSGNLIWKIGQMPSTHTVVMVALLPIPMMNRTIPQNWRAEELQTI